MIEDLGAKNVDLERNVSMGRVWSMYVSLREIEATFGTLTLATEICDIVAWY